jgi:hypothetical protein
VEPLAPARYLVKFTVGEACQARLVRVQELLGRQVAPGDLETVFDQALQLLEAKLEKQKNGATDRPPKKPRPVRPDSRHVPAELKRAVQARDGGQCSYVGRDGRRCTARSGLEYGPSTRLRWADRRRSRTSPCAAGRTTDTKPSSASGPGAANGECARARRLTE